MKDDDRKKDDDKKKDSLCKLGCLCKGRGRTSLLLTASSYCTA